MEIARLAANDLPDRSYVNLGLGIPELVAGVVPIDRRVVFHSEIGVLGFGSAPAPGREDPDLVCAGMLPVTAMPGACFLDQAESFAIARGGHIDLCLLGAMQVSERGDIANWLARGPEAVPAVGGAMDFVVGARRIWVLCEHSTRTGAPKLVGSCTLPLTGSRVVRRIYTNLAVVDLDDDGFLVRALAPGFSIEEVRRWTGAPLRDGRQQPAGAVEATPHPGCDRPAAATWEFPVQDRSTLP